MAVVIINPNSTPSMTDAMVRAAQAAVPNEIFEGWTSHDGPPAIQGAADGAAATAPLLKLVRAAGERDDVRGIVIGCFDDTALREAAEIAFCPVIGIGQASYHLAALRHWRFGVVTTLPVSVPIIESNIQDLGLGAHLGRVRASNVAVLDLEDSPEASRQAIVNEAKIAVREDRIDALVLGCAGMVGIAHAVRAAVQVPVIDPVAAAALCMAWLLP